MLREERIQRILTQSPAVSRSTVGVSVGGRRLYALAYGTVPIVAVSVLAVLLVIAAGLHDKRVEAVCHIERRTARSTVDWEMTRLGAVVQESIRNHVLYAFPFPTRGLMLEARYDNDLLQDYVLQEGSDRSAGPPLSLNPRKPPSVILACVFAICLTTPLFVAWALRIGATGGRLTHSEMLTMKVFALLFEAVFVCVILVFLRKSGMG